MAITRRLAKGSALEYVEIDNNFSELDTRLGLSETKVANLELETTSIQTSITTVEQSAADATATVEGSQLHPYYHFHGCALSQAAGDKKFFDLAGLNHGAPTV